MSDGCPKCGGVFTVTLFASGDGISWSCTCGSAGPIVDDEVCPTCNHTISRKLVVSA